MGLTREQRERVIKVAESWVGTPFRAWTCIKGVGCDCGQLIKGVYIEAGFIFPDGIPTPKNYSLQVSQHRKSTEYNDIIEKYMRQIPESEVQPGDVVLFKIGHGFAHASIIRNWPNDVIHAFNDRYGVTSGSAKGHRFSHLPKKFYTLKDEFCMEKETE